MFLLYTDPPGNKMLWRRCSDVSLYVPVTLQVRLVWNTQGRLSGTSPKRPDGTSPRHLIRMSWLRLKGTLWRRPISISPRRLRQVSNEAPSDVSVVRHQDVSVVRTHDAPLVRLYDVSCNSQMRYPITSLWHVSTTSRSYVVVTHCLYYGLYYILKLLCHDIHLVGVYVSFKYQIKHQIFLVSTRGELRGVVLVIN